jgi:hypothetical protein
LDAVRYPLELDFIQQVDFPSKVKNLHWPIVLSEYLAHFAQQSAAEVPLTCEYCMFLKSCPAIQVDGWHVAAPKADEDDPARTTAPRANASALLWAILTGRVVGV